MTRPIVPLAIAMAVVAVAPALVRSGARAEGPLTARDVKLSADRGAPGRGIVASGIVFSDKPGDIEITVGSRRVSPTSTSRERVSFSIPQDEKPGPLTIRFEVKGGERGMARYQVLAGKELADALEKEKTREGTGADRPSDYDTSFLTITTFTITPALTPTAVLIEGTTKLPPTVSLEIKFGLGSEYDPPTRATKVGIRDGAWKATFTAAPGKVFPAGRYFATADFEFAHQGSSVVLPKEWTEGERAARQRIHTITYLTLGTPAELENQTDARRAHYQDLVKRSQEALDTLERAYAATGRCYFKKTATACDEDAWAKWARDRGVGESDDELAKLKKDERFLKGPFWNPGAWQQWLDTDFEKTLAAIWQNHEAMNATYERHAEGLELEADLLVGTVLAHARTYTGELAAWNHLANPAWNPADLAGVPQPGDVTRGDFDRHKQALLARLAAATEKPVIPNTDVKKGDKK